MNFVNYYYHSTTEQLSLLMLLPGDSYVPDILVASDVVQGKLGYGLVSECLASGIPLLYVSREYWAEERHLAEHMRSHHCCVRMTTDDFYDGNNTDCSLYAV